MTGASVPGSIAVPISLAMVSGQQGIIMPNIITTSSPTANTAITSQCDATAGYVTMVTNVAPTTTAGTTALQSILQLPIGMSSTQIQR